VPRSKPNLLSTSILAELFGILDLLAAVPLGSGVRATVAQGSGNGSADDGESEERKAEGVHGM
jgi:hypothetical protein